MHAADPNQEIECTLHDLDGVSDDAVVRAWARIESHFSRTASELAPPASIDHLDHLARLLGHPLPPELTRSLRVHDGQRSGGDGLRFLAAAEIVRATLRASLDAEASPGPVPAGPGVRPVVWTFGWVPFMRDKAGNSLVIDMVPDVGGTPCQVVACPASLGKRRVIARSLTEWLMDLSLRLDLRRAT